MKGRLSTVNIYDFFNSPDVSEYCQSIGKTWTSLEMAVIIGKSDRPQLEKHVAWSELIFEYPDMPTPNNLHHISYDSLHQKISELLVYEKHAAENFKTSEPGAIYSCDAGVYSSFDKAFKGMQEKYNRDEVDRWLIKKQFVDDKEELHFCLDYDGNLFDFSFYGFYYKKLCSGLGMDYKKLIEFNCDFLLMFRRLSKKVIWWILWESPMC